MVITQEQRESASRPCDAEQDRLLDLYMQRRKAKEKKPAKAKVKPQRIVRVEQPLDHHGYGGIICIQQGKETDFYLLNKIASDFGSAFQVQKANYDGEPSPCYDVLLDGPRSSCSCPGHTYRPNGPQCRHLAALTALMQCGKL